MGLLRHLLLAGSRSQWLREQAPRHRFVRRAVERFMPGEELEDALKAAHALEAHGLRTLFTHLGENITDGAEARRVREHYLHVLDRIRETGLFGEISVKLTQLGLDLGTKECWSHLVRLVEHAGPGNLVWIDMESSEYVDRTIELFCALRRKHPNVGVCLQAYLRRTTDDLAALLPMGPAIRLVKGAYQEPSKRAFPRKRDVDRNFFELACRMLSAEARQAGVRAAIATHDRKLIARIEQWAVANDIGREAFEFQMLYGIQRAEQLRLASEGYRSHVLIAYGSYWFPWFMRRLAERPANAWFLARNLFSG